MKNERKKENYLRMWIFFCIFAAELKNLDGIGIN